jgi:hypothetical protein
MNQFKKAAVPGQQLRSAPDSRKTISPRFRWPHVQKPVPARRDAADHVGTVHDSLPTKPGPSRQTEDEEVKEVPSNSIRN